MRRHGRHALLATLLALSLPLTSSALLAADEGEGAKPTPPAATAAAPAEAAPAAEEAREALAEPEETAPPASAQVERGGLLVGAGRQEVEYRLSYAHFSSNTIFIEGVAILPVIVVGEIAVERLRRDILIGSWTWRLGLRDDLQVELRVPYRYQHDRSAIPEATPPQERTQDDRGIGDISAAVYRQLPGRPWGQQLIAGVQVKSRTGRDVFETIHVEMMDDIPVIVQDGLPTGTGFWSMKGMLTGVRISDPAALFWNLGYTCSLPREDVTVFSRDLQTTEVTASTVKVSPGSTIEYGFGLAYALNPDVSLSAQFQQALTQSTCIRELEEGSAWVAGSTINAATFRLGAVWAPGERSSTDISVTFGLTEDSPDTVVEFRRTFSG